MDSDNLIQQLMAAFPDFKVEEEEHDLPTVVFAFFSYYIQNALKSGNDELVERIINFLNGMLGSNNPVWESCLDEIALGLDKQRVQFLSITKPLNEGLHKRLNETIKMWESGLKINSLN